VRLRGGRLINPDLTQGSNVAGWIAALQGGRKDFSIPRRLRLMAEAIQTRTFGLGHGSSRASQGSLKVPDVKRQRSF